MGESGFILQKFCGVPYYSCREFEALPRLRHGFSTCHGRLSGTGESSFNLGCVPWDSPERVRENRRRFLAALNLEHARLATLHQIHSDRVHIIKDNPGQWNRSDGDAICTRTENVALAAQTADCVPVLLADPEQGAVAAVHSGWRGTLKGILPKTIQKMAREFDSDPSGILIALGPGIRACCFEVGPEVAGPFEEQYPGCSLTKPLPESPQKRFLDLFKALQIQMNRAGVPVENRFDLGVCTCCHTDEFFSHRAERAAAGRMLAVIGLLR